MLYIQKKRDWSSKKKNQWLKITGVERWVKKNNIKHESAIGRSWEEFEKDVYTADEIRESDLRVSLISEFIRARDELGISQKKLEELSGVKQPIIARMEKGYSNPQIETVLKLLAPMGKTLAIVPIK